MIRLLVCATAATLPFVLIACGGAGEARTPGGRGGGPRGGEDRATPVEIAVATLGRINRTTTLASTIEPIRVVGVNAQLAGALGTVRVLEGARVREGEVLATIDVQELEAQLASADAALKFAESTARRSEELYRARIVTATEFERDRAALAAAQASLDALRARAAFSSVRAPITGLVTERFVESGDIVSPNMRLFTVADVSTLVTRVLVSELEVGSMRPGQEVRLTVDAVPGERFTARIRRIFPVADSTTRMIPVEVALAASDNAKLRPGYTARATFSLEARDDAVLVPARAVLGTAGSQAVFLLMAGKPIRRGVRTGAEVSGQLEIVEGLNVGDTVVVAGVSEVREGGEVRIVQPLEPDDGRAGPGVRAAPVRDTTAASRRERP